jgi:hypothetical protein
MASCVGLVDCTKALKRTRSDGKTETPSIKKIKDDLMTNIKKANNTQEI